MVIRLLSLLTISSMSAMTEIPLNSWFTGLRLSWWVWWVGMLFLYFGSSGAYVTFSDAGGPLPWHPLGARSFEVFLWCGYLESESCNRWWGLKVTLPPGEWFQQCGNIFFKDCARGINQGEGSDPDPGGIRHESISIQTTGHWGNRPLSWHCPQNLAQPSWTKGNQSVSCKA